MPCPLSLHLLTSMPSSRLCLGTIFIGKPFWLFQNPPRLGSSAYAFSLPIPAYKLLASLRAKTTTLDLCMPNSQARTEGTLMGVWPHSHSLLTQRSSGVSSNKTRNSLCQDTFIDTKAYHRLNTCQPFQKCHQALSPMFSIGYTFLFTLSRPQGFSWEMWTVVTIKHWRSLLSASSLEIRHWK